MVLVAGEAGAGKSSLVRAFARSVSDSSDVVEGACDPLATPRPLGPLHDFAADPGGVFAGVVVDDGPAIDLFDTVLSHLRAAGRPVVMVIEDVHWADDATLDLLRFLGRRIARTNALLLCTYRDDEVGTQHPLQHVIGQLGPLEHVSRVDVPRFTLAAVSELAAT